MPGKRALFVLRLCLVAVASTSCRRKLKQGPPELDATAGGGSATAVEQPLGEAEWSAFCKNLRAYDGKCNQLPDPRLAFCEGTRDCAPRAFNVAAIHALDQCVQKGVCDPFCTSAVSTTTPPSDAFTRFASACKSHQASCPAFQCDAFVASRRATLFGNPILASLTACMDKSCNAAEDCTFSVLNLQNDEFVACTSGFVPLSAAERKALAQVVANPQPAADAGAQAAGAPAGDGTAVGQTLGKVSPTIMAGRGAVDLNAQRGKVVLLHLCASWATPCAPSMVELQKLSDKLRGRFEPLVISVDDTLPDAMKLAATPKVKLHMEWDERKSVRNATRFKTTPQTVIIDKKGVIRFVHDGYYDGDATKWEKEVRSLL